MRRRFRVVGGKLLADEESVVKQITDGLNLARLPWYRVRERIPGDSAPSMPGIPDIGGWVVRNAPPLSVRPIPFYIEVKRMGRHQKRPAQIEFIERAKHDGCVAFFAQGWDDCVREFRAFGIELPS